MDRHGLPAEPTRPWAPLRPKNGDNYTRNAGVAARNRWRRTRLRGRKFNIHENREFNSNIRAAARGSPISAGTREGSTPASLLIKNSGCDGYHTGAMATKSQGVGRGGKRRGAGRPAGSRNKRTVLMEILPQLEKQDRQLPLYRLLNRIADESLDARYRDVLSIACLPFLHSRLSPSLSAKPPYLMSDAELDETLKAQEAHEKQVRRRAGHLNLIKGPE
jgi:hypothetical protein